VTAGWSLRPALLPDAAGLAALAGLMGLDWPGPFFWLEGALEAPEASHLKAFSGGLLAGAGRRD
jgi:hypothetical protein